MTRHFEDKVVLVTGASRGIGREIASAFGRQGAKIVLAARSAELLRAVKREIEALGSTAIAVPTDVSDEASVRVLIDTALTEFGRLDVLVNNAGIARVGGVAADAFATDLQQTLQASLFGMIHVTRRALPVFVRQGSGAIVNMSSVMGRKAFASFGSYAIVMHGVSAFSDALRQELAGSNIRVSVIHPGLTATALLDEADPADMPPPFRYMTPISPAAVASAVVQAVRRGTRRVVLPRTANMLLLGEALSPWLGDLIARALTVRPVARLLGMREAKPIARQSLRPRRKKEHGSFGTGVAL